jgi:hypothetical protein
MISIKSFDHPVTSEELNELGRTYPVVYVFCHWAGVYQAIGFLFTRDEPGEVAVVTPFDPGGPLWRRFGRTSTQAMLAFSLNTPYGGADRPGGYAEAVEGARRWRRKNKAAEARGWPDAPWLRSDGDAMDDA